MQKNWMNKKVIHPDSNPLGVGDYLHCNYLF